MASKTPVTIAVVVSLTLILCILFLLGAIGGSYLLTLHAIHVQEAAQLKAGIPTCEALLALDHAKDGIVFSPPTKTGTAELYVIKFATALHKLILATDCNKVLHK